MMAAGISDWGMLVATGEGGTLEAELSGSCNHQLDLLRRTRAWFDRWLRDEAPDGEP
jgi:hypothetical protein